MRFASFVFFCLFIVWPGLGLADTSDPNDLLTLPAIKTERIASSVMMDITLAGERVVMVGELGRIAYSDDQGDTWQLAKVPVSVTLTAVSFPTPSLGWAVGHDGVILHSRDRGETWELQMDGNQFNAIVLEQVNELVRQKDEEIANAEETELDELELQREDLMFFRSDAEMAVREGATRPFMDLWFQDDQKGIVVGAFGMIFRTTDGGAHWEPLIDRMDNPDGFHYYGITRSGDNLFIAGELGMLFRSEDNGDSWLRLDAPYEGSYFGITGHPDGDFLLAYGLGGNTFVSNDSGESWSEVDKPITSALSAAAVTGDATILMVAYDGTCLRSVDGGHSFTALEGRFPGSIALQAVTPERALVVGLNGLSQFEIKKAGK